MLNCVALQAVAPSGRHDRGAVLPPAALTMFACRRLRLYRASRGVASRRCNAQRAKSASLLYAHRPHKTHDDESNCRKICDSSRWTCSSCRKICDNCYFGNLECIWLYNIQDIYCVFWSRRFNKFRFSISRRSFSIRRRSYSLNGLQYIFATP